MCLTFRYTVQMWIVIWAFGLNFNFSLGLKLFGPIQRPLWIWEEVINNWNRGINWDESIVCWHLGTILGRFCRDHLWWSKSNTKEIRKERLEIWGISTLSDVLGRRQPSHHEIDKAGFDVPVYREETPAWKHFTCKPTQRDL